MALGVKLDGVSVVFRQQRRGDVVAVKDLTLEIKPGEFLTLLGASGCGKTTVLRMIAGFQRPTSGHVLIGETDVTARAANQRDIGFVFQNYALFPHLSVFENVAYGLRVKRLDKRDIRQRVEEGLHQVGLDGYGERMIPELSGGQQQRVALARAIVIQPDVLLFDEPLSNLDAQLRIQMRSEIRRLQKELKITAVYVTHDQEEAMAISDRIAIMNAGQIEQIGTAEDLYLRPASRFVATFLGDANLIEGAIIDAGMDWCALRISGSRWNIVSPRRMVGSSVVAVLRPETIGLLDPQADRGLKGTIVSATYLGSKVEYQVRVGDLMLQVVQASPTSGARFVEGCEVAVSLPHLAVHILGDGNAL
jgi:ABC-type Fe3+/spermidine/putrescine transport system ATPase subunit